MSLPIDPGGLAGDAASHPAADQILWHHAAFCRAGLPVRAPRGTWQRAVGPVTLRIEPGATEHTLPGGALLRLVLMQVCDAAMRANAAVIELGETPAALAERIGAGVKPREVADQLERMLAAKISIAMEHGPALGVFDARARPRAAGGPWRPQVRMNGGFFGSLAGQAVALDRRVVQALAEHPLALDAYAWIRLSLQERPADATVTTSWDELAQAFGSGTQDLASFRAGFEAALRQVFDADLSIALAVDEEGVSLRRAGSESAEPEEPATEPARAPALPVTTAPASPAAAAPAIPAVAPAASPPRAEPATEPPPAAAPPTTRPGASVPIDAAAEADRPLPAAPVTAAPVPAAPVPAAPVPAAPVPVPPPAAVATPAPAVAPPTPPAVPPRPAPVPAPGGTAAPREEPPPRLVQDTISLRSHVTGLPQVIWLRRGHGEDSALVGVTPGTRFDADRLTVLAVEPIVVQVSGGLFQQDFERVSAWVMANRDLIDDFWEGHITTFEEITRRVRKVPSPGWR